MIPMRAAVGPRRRSAAWLGALWLVAAGFSDASADCTPLGLPVVTVGDLNADGRTTGRDLEQALGLCDQLGGCVLDLLARTYDDVALLIYQGDSAACTPERTTCSVHALPKGLVIRGQGAASVLRSPLWTPPYKPEPIIEIRGRPDLRFQMRDLVLDGRKQDQVAPTPGVNDMDTWQHRGFIAWNARFFPTFPLSRNGCVENVTARNLFNSGLVLGDAAHWTLRNNTVEDIGCHSAFTPCPRLGLPADPFTLLPGETVSGYGISIGARVEDLELEDNVVRRTTKYAVSLKHGTDGLTASIKRPRVTGNQLLDVGHHGFFLAGVADGVVQDNRVDSTHVHGETPERATWPDTSGIACFGVVERTTFSGNEILNSAGIGFNYQCVGEHNLVEHTRITGSCRTKDPELCSPYGNCYDLPDFQVNAESGSLTVRNVQIHDTACSAPFGVTKRAHVVLNLLGVDARQNVCDRIDLSGDGTVSSWDQVVFTDAMQKCQAADHWIGACVQTDLDEDGVVGWADLQRFYQVLGACVSP